jgi:predicted MFS family arabinose efflux permease
MLNGLRRFPYLILTPMAAALNLPRETVASMLSGVWFISLLGPFAGTAIDRSGRKRMMLIGMLLLIVGLGLCIIGSALPGLFGVLMGGILIGSFGKTLFDPSMQAYIGDRVPYERRGMVLGYTELAWSGSLAIFAPLAAFLIANVSLSSIYGVLLVGAVVATIILHRVLPRDQAGGRTGSPQNLREGIKIVLRNRSALALLGVIMIGAVALDIFLIVYERWLRSTFSLGTEQIGLIAPIFSLAELAGELFIIALSDRLGKRRLMLIGTFMVGVCFLVVPWMGFSLPAAIATLFGLFFFFEISVITLIPIATELSPEARGTILTLIGASIALGRGTGTLLGGPIFALGGFMLAGTVAGVINIIAAGVAWRFIQERR